MHKLSYDSAPGCWIGASDILVSVFSGMCSFPVLAAVDVLQVQNGL